MSGANAVQGVVFDVDGTLVVLRASIGELYAEALQELGVSVDGHELERAAVTTWGSFEAEYLNVAEFYATQPSRETLVWCEFVRRVLRQVDAGLSTRWDLIAGVYSFFAQGRSRRVVEGAVEACRDLAASGLVVIAATNNDQRTPSVLADLGFSPHISRVFTAGELGWKKPSPKFFRQISSRVGLPASALVHVGNSPAHDVDAAREAGFQAVLYDPQGRGEEPRVGSLTELVSRLLRQADMP